MRPARPVNIVCGMRAGPPAFARLDSRPRCAAAVYRHPLLASYHLLTIQVMPMLDTDATSARVSRIVHLDTQRAEAGLDLTVGAVFRVTGGGQLDFGGSEFEPAAREELVPERANPEDDYGWWDLKIGTYLIRYNEALELGVQHVAQVFPHERLLRAGATHAAFVVDTSRDSIETLLTVGEAGCRLKENSRVSRVLMAEVT